ncbi:MAG: 3-dehydroquinate synthase [Patescibacteria group bacterium]|nr:3-dehydroquinate synthase [Patescibacteria group bacterium]
MIIPVKLKKKEDRSYKIIVEDGLIDRIPSLLNYGVRYAVIADSKVGKLYGQKLVKRLGKKAKLFTFPHGERSKNLFTVEALCKKMLKENFDRHDCIIALGGGVTGDIAGFVSSIYMRGIPYVQVPTSLLAMVDSSVGGKTGVDMEEGKNLLGTFLQPKAVYIDPLLLKTLPKKHFVNGMAEVVKYGCIKSKSLFRYISKNYEKILTLEPKPLNKIIVQSCKIKRDIVEKDEHEKLGLRMCLNFGHTIGHAIEKLTDYTILHGEAVAIGMVQMCRDKRLTELLKKIGLPTKIPKGIKKSHILEVIKKDKKKKGKKIMHVLVKKIGKAILK